MTAQAYLGLSIQVVDLHALRLGAERIDAPAGGCPVDPLLSRRPDMLAALAAQRAGQAGVAAARAEFLPKVFTAATGPYNRGHVGLSAIPSVGEQLPTLNLSDRSTNATLLVGVTVPLFDGGTRAARLEQARDRADSSVAALARTRDQAVREIVVAENGLHTSLAAYAASREVSLAAKTSLDAALGAFRSGVGSITDVNLAQQQLLTAANASGDAYSAALTAAATLALATGSLGGSPG